MILHGYTTSKLPMEFICNNNSVLGGRNIAETFNQYFLNIGINLADKIEPSTINHNAFLTEEFKNSLYFYPTDASEVISVCNTLKNKSSSSMTKLSLGLLKLL